jgi:hypothetical protein
MLVMNLCVCFWSYFVGRLLVMRLVCSALVLVFVDLAWMLRLGLQLELLAMLPPSCVLLGFLRLLAIGPEYVDL